MAIYGFVHGAHEAFDTHAALAELARDRHVGLAESEQDFHQRAHDLIECTRPDHSPGFADYVTRIAWSRHTTPQLRLTIPPAALRLIAQFADTLTDQPGAADLRAAVTQAAARAGWTAPTQVTPPGAGEDVPPS